MFEEKVLIPTQLPLPEKNRKSTDLICTVIGAIFALTLFIVACVQFNMENYNFKFLNLYDGSGNVCSEKQKLSITNFENQQKNVCVAQCPATYSQVSRICLPSHQSQIQKYLEAQPYVRNYLEYGQLKWVFLYSSLVAVGIGLFWLVFTHCFPKLAAIVVYVLAAASLITLGVLILTLQIFDFSQVPAFQIVVPVLCFVLAVISLIMICFYANAAKFQGLFLHYATRFLNRNPSTFIYLIIHLIFFVGLITLTVWQHICFSSQIPIKSNFYNFADGSVWKILNIIQFIWAAQFIRDSFNFCVSGAAVDYYWSDRNQCYLPFKRLVCNHWGSIVGGSFLNAFFEIPTLLVQLFTCHPNGCLGKFGVCCHQNCNCLTCFFDLVRTDSYSYITLAGIPFCNAARQCKKICSSSKQFIGHYSPIKHYKFIAQVFAVTASLIPSLFILESRTWANNFWDYLILIILIYTFSCLFVNLHADAAEGLQTSYLCERKLQPNHSLLQRVHPDYIPELEQWEKRQLQDGNF